MQYFAKLVAVTALATFVAATPTAEIKERQLSGLPSIVCLTGVLSGLLPSNISIVECSATETCTALNIPTIGSLLPIGTCA